MRQLAHDTVSLSAYRGEEDYIFASYSHADAREVYAELVRLDRAGFKIWYDEGIAPSMRWTQEIAGAIDGCSVFVAFITPGFVASENCIDELEFAIAHHKPVLAIHLVPTELSPGLQLTLGSKQALIKYRYAPDAYAHKLQQTLQALLCGGSQSAQSPPGAGAASADVSTRPALRRSSAAKTFWQRASAVAVTLAILATAGLYFFSDDEGPINSIAILPFFNDDADPDTDYLAEGISESITNDLSGIQSLRVMAQSSVRRYRGQQVDARTVGDELGVRAVLMGSIRSRGEQLRIQTELIDTDTGAQIWGQQETRDRQELLAFQNEIAARISSSLKVQFSGNEQARAAERYTPNAGAYELYLKGRYHWNERTNEGYRQAIELFRQAIDLDPDYARAYVGLADSQAFLEIEGVPPRDQYETALGIIAKALELDATLGEAHASYALLMHNKDWDFTSAEREYRRAIDLTPSYASAYHWCAELLVQLGRFDEAFELYRQAQALDPLSSAIGSDVGLAWHYSRDHDRAMAELRKSIEADPDFSRTYRYLATVYAHVGRYAEAVDAQQEAWLMAGDEPDAVEQRTDALRAALEGSGPPGFWRQQLELEKAASGERDRPVRVAQLYARLGERERAFALLERAYAARLFAMLFLNVDPAWDVVRDDPRFQDLLVRIGFPAESTAIVSTGAHRHR